MESAKVLYAPAWGQVPLEEAGTGFWPPSTGARVASHMALGRLHPARAEAPGRSPPPSTREAQPGCRSLSEVHGLIPWMGCPFCPQKVLVASHQPQGLAEELWGCVGGTQLAGQCSTAVKVGARGDTGPEGREDRSDTGPRMDGGAQGDTGPSEWFVT